MAVRDPGKEPPEQGPEGAGQEVDRAALFAQSHDAQPQAHDSGEPEGDLEARLGEVEGRADHRRPHPVVAEKDGLHEADREGDQEERAPDLVQHGATTDRALRTCNATPIAIALSSTSKSPWWTEWTMPSASLRTPRE